MERAPGQLNTPRFLFDWGWRRLIWQFLPVVAMVLGALLLARDLTGGGGTSPSPAKVDADYQARLAENINFFETRVVETNDSLSYNRLTSLYLERLRLSGDVSDVRRAELAADKGIQVAPNAYASVTAMASVRLAQHEFTAALALVNQADGLKPGVPETYALRGDALMALGRYDEAGDNYRQYLDKSPGFSAFSRQAVFAETNGNVDLAIQFWQAAIDSTKVESPIDSAWARVQLGNFSLTTGKLKMADEQYATALNVFPGYPLAEAGQARLAATRGDYKQSAALYKTVTTKLPSPEFVAPYADVARLAGDQAEATRQASLLGAIGQLFAANGIVNDLTLINFKLDHGDTSSETLASAKAAYDDRPSLAAADTYAWALYRAGNFDDAAKYSAESLRLGTKEPLYLFHAGMIARAQGDSATAREQLSQALAINPSFHPVHAPEAKTQLQKLAGAK
ncbi:MAG: tetratricopeptide repeat protein [bacterium]